jgi:hypothetical protein
MKFEGIDEFAKILKDVPREISKRGTQNALKKAAKPIEDQASINIKKRAKGRGKGGFSKMLLLSHLVYSRVYKGGVTVQIRGGRDIPVEGLKGRDSFTAFGWARLMAQGRQWTAKTSSERLKYKPRVKETRGYGDFIDDAFDKRESQAKAIFKRVYVPEVQKAFNRALKKHGIRG